MKISKETLKKYKVVLALAMTMLITTGIVKYKSEEKYKNLDNAGVSCGDNKTITAKNLFVLKTKEDVFLIFCPEKRGVCVNYETEQFMFMYTSEEEKMRNLKLYFGEDISLENFEKYLIEISGKKKNYNTDEIFNTFNNIKNDNKKIIKK